MNVRTFLTAGMLVVLGLMLGGCSEGKNPVYKVHGRLTYNGQPMSKASISFYPIDPSKRSTSSHGTADDDGRFDMHTYRAGDGVPAGEYVVTIYWPAPLSKNQVERLEKAETVEEKDAIATPDLLNNLYSDPLKTKLKATVGEKDNEIDFKLP